MAGGGRDRFYFVLLTILTLAVAGWYGWRWHLAARQEEQNRELPSGLATTAPGPVSGYELQDTVPVQFVRYGTVLYHRVAVRFTPEPQADEVRVEACGYEPASRPWLQHRETFSGRSPHLAVSYREFTSETAALAARLDDLPGFTVDFSDSRGITCLRRNVPLAREPNEMAVVRLGREVWVFDAVDDPVGLRAVAAAGFRYGLPGRMTATAPP